MKLLLALLLIAAPAQAGNLTIHNKQIHRPQRNMQETQLRVHRINYHQSAERQFGRGFHNDMRCSGRQCTINVTYSPFVK